MRPPSNSCRRNRRNRRHFRGGDTPSPGPLLITRTLYIAGRQSNLFQRSGPVPIPFNSSSRLSSHTRRYTLSRTTLDLLLRLVLKFRIHFSSSVFCLSDSSHSSHLPFFFLSHILLLPAPIPLTLCAILSRLRRGVLLGLVELDNPLSFYCLPAVLNFSTFLPCLYYP